MSAAALLRLESVSFAYPGREPLLRSLDFALEAGSASVLCGRSGSGKTTLLRIAAAQLAPSRGRVLLEGNAYLRPSRKVFYVHQEDDLFDWLTVDGHIRLAAGLAADAREEREREGRALAERLGLAPFLALYPKSLSLGMKRKLAILRALLLRPRVLLLDETLSSLDREQREEIARFLRGWASDTDAAALFVSHFPEELGALGMSVRDFAQLGSPA